MKIFKKLFLTALSVIMLVSCFGCGKGKDAKPEGEEKPKGEATIKIGVLSDTQLEAGVPSTASNYYAEKQFERGLTYYKNENVDAVFIMGDLVNNAKDSSWEIAVRVINKVYPDEATRPEFIYDLGNHERYNGETNYANPDQEEWCRDQFTKYTGQEPRVHKKVKGYSFLTVPSEHYTPAEFSMGSIRWLEKELAKIDAESDGRPVFVGIHEPIANTVYGEGFVKQSAEMNGVLSKYPNVILFSAHSHFPIADERSIFQKSYTVINTGSCSYCCLGVNAQEEGKNVIKNTYGKTLDNMMHDGSMRPMPNKHSGVDAHHQGLGLIVRVYDNVTEVERRNFNENTTLGNKWYIPTNPNAADDFYYTAEKRAEADLILPEWDENHNAEAYRDNYTVVVNWEDAHWGSSPVEVYEVKLVEKGKNKARESTCIVSDYYAGIGESKYQVKITSMDKNTKFQIVITGYDCFNNASDPLYLEIAATPPKQTVN